MNFTADNTTDRAPNWLIWLNEFIGKPTKALEIGAYEGRSSIWFAENILTHPASSLVCIDAWVKIEPYASRGTDMELVYARFETNIEQFEDKICSWRGPSNAVLRELDPFYDFAYIDGSHWPVNVLEDSVLVFDLVRPGGIIIWDDYEWQYKGPLSTPKIAIDAFLAVYEGKYKLIHKGYQVAVEKISA